MSHSYITYGSIARNGREKEETMDTIGGDRARSAFGNEQDPRTYA